MDVCDSRHFRIVMVRGCDVVLKFFGLFRLVMDTNNSMILILIDRIVDWFKILVILKILG